MKLIILSCLIFFLGCSPNQSTSKPRQKQIGKSHSTVPDNIVIVIQPLDGISSEEATKIHKKIKAVYSNSILLPAIPLPDHAWYATRNRYRADKLIRWLSTRAKNNQVIAGITSKDISSTKGSIKDWGIMGLGQCPGNSCVASTFRLKSDAQFYKVILHELGHTQGLQHCPVKTCYMRDAEGRNPTDQEIEFCSSCEKVLLAKGWKL